jgi:hypothetical protein
MFERHARAAGHTMLRGAHFAHHFFAVWCCGPFVVHGRFRFALDWETMLFGCP